MNKWKTDDAADVFCTSGAGFVGRRHSLGSQKHTMKKKALLFFWKSLHLCYLKTHQRSAHGTADFDPIGLNLYTNSYRVCFLCTRACWGQSQVRDTASGNVDAACCGPGTSLRILQRYSCSCSEDHSHTAHQEADQWAVTLPVSGVLRALAESLAGWRHLILQPFIFSL